MGGSVSTSAKQIFLKYYKQNREFLLDEAAVLETDALWTDMLVEINHLPHPGELGEHKRSWKELLPDWTNEVRDKFKNSIDNDEMVYLSSEDFQLLNMDCLDIEASLMPIVKYFEKGEFESLKELVMDITLQEWEIELMDYLKRLIHKKKLFDFNRHHFILEHPLDETKDFFTALELKLLSLISDSDYKSLVLDNRFKIEICRVCCHHKPNSMLDIFSCSPDGLSFASKIGMCVEVAPIDEQDTLPKSICRDCADNLGNCFEFQKLCRESDFELRRDKTLRDMIMEQVLDKTMGSMGCNLDGWNSSSDILKTINGLDQDKGGIFVGEEKKSSDDCAASVSDTCSSLGTTDLLLQSTKDENCDIRKYQCELCGARFFDVYNFKTHWRIHKVVKKYECSDCGKKFRTNVMLKIHMRTHTGERPFSCETCSKTFKTASAVTSHQAVHATVKAFKCELCPYEGTTKPNLRIHMRTHSKEQPYLCKQCGKRFSTASNLLKHSRNIHQRLKTNKCPLCEKGFFSRESAKKHLITHTDRKPYNCKNCPNVAYSWYSGLEKHYQKYHKRSRIPAESHFKGRVEKALTETLRVTSGFEVGTVGGGGAPAFP